MSNAVSTESRIFAKNLTRELAARERSGAALLSPGATEWKDAFHRFAQTVAKAGSPTKAARLFRAALDRLGESQKAGGCYVNCFMRRSRSAFFEVLAWQVTPHPVTKSGYDGVSVQSHVCRLQRNGMIGVYQSPVKAFISWHALARMYERTDVNVFEADSIVGLCGVAGLLMGISDKHVGTGINFAFHDVIATGVLRSTEIDGRRHKFFDVLTVLQRDDERFALKWEQGCALWNAVREYVTGDDADIEGYADKIPVLPIYDGDYVSRLLSTDKVSNASG